MNLTRIFMLSAAAVATLTFASCSERITTWQKATPGYGTDVYASILIKRGCGYARSGDKAWVVNNLPYNRVKVTVNKWCPLSGDMEDIHMVLEPSEVFALGCTLGPDGDHPRYQFLITKCSIVGGGRYVSDGKTVVE